MRLPKFQIIEKPADFACGHTAPIRTQIDRAASPEVEALAHSRLVAAKARAKKMQCMRCIHAQWNEELSGAVDRAATQEADDETTLQTAIRFADLIKAAEWAVVRQRTDCCPWCEQTSVEGHASDCPAFNGVGSLR